MLIILSDIHIGDGTCGQSISSGAFRLFAARLKELAFNASWHTDGSYHPLDSVDILLLGDILEVQHSTLWLEKAIGEPGCVRPWTDPRAPEFAAKIDAITKAVLQKNTESVAILKALTQPGGLTLPPVNSREQPDLKASDQLPVPVRLHYMIGNHDWFYHLPGLAFDAIRHRIVEAFSLHNSDQLFPYELKESVELQDLLSSYGVYARHGDMFDILNFDKSRGRDSPSLGDALAVEILNRFPDEVTRHLGNELPPALIESMRKLVNVRPVLATPLWICSELRQNDIRPSLQKKLKHLWNEMCNECLALPFVREYNKPFKLDIVDGLELAIRLTNQVSFNTIDDLAVWIRKKFDSEEITFARHALKEEAFLNQTAQFIVYGHTHHAEIVPLDTFPTAKRSTSQIYLNSGTWHTYFDLAVCKPEEQKFVPYQVLTYLAFYKDDKRGGRRFETWSGAFSD
jgi:UDP-2,3-diacylglucosamine pyrophosphatase LpxH